MLTQIRSGTYFATESTTESSGFRCGDFSSSGSGVQCSGSAFYDSGRFEDVSGAPHLSNDLTEIAFFGRAEAEFGSLKTEAALTYTPIDPLSLDEGTYFEILNTVRDNPSYGSVFTSASFGETFTISGGDNGSEGTIKFFYHVDGSSITPTITNGNETASGGSSTHISIGEIITFDNPQGEGTITTLKSGTVTTILTTFNGTYDEIVELPLNFIFGEEFTLNVSLYSLASFYFFDYSPSSFFAFSTSSNFFNTALLNDIQVFDENGGQIEFGLSAGSGSQVFEQFSTLDDATTVPEPVSLVLLGLGLAGIKLSRKMIVFNSTS